MRKRSHRQRKRHDRIQLPRPPLSVWVTSQRDPATELIDRGYHIDTAADSQRVPPAVAEHAIEAYCPPRGIVLDPDCGAGTVLVEALRTGRSAIGLTAHRAWRTLATANVNTIRYTDVVADGMALVAAGGGKSLSNARRAGLDGRIALVLTALRAPASGGTPDTVIERLRALLAGTRPLLRPGAHVVIATPPDRYCESPAGYLGRVLDAGQSLGLVPVERCVALTRPLRGGKITGRAVRRTRDTTDARGSTPQRPIVLPAHLDIAVLEASAAAERGETAHAPVRPIRRTTPTCSSGCPDVLAA